MNCAGCTVRRCDWWKKPSRQTMAKSASRRSDRNTGSASRNRNSHEIANRKSNDFCPSIFSVAAAAAAAAGVAEGPARLAAGVFLFVGAAGARDAEHRRSRAGGFSPRCAGWCWRLFIVALAQPRLTKSTTEVKASGIDIVAALDLSGSMISEDFVVKGERVNRVNMAKSVLKRFH